MREHITREILRVRWEVGGPVKLPRTFLQVTELLAHELDQRVESTGLHVGPLGKEANHHCDMPFHRLDRSMQSNHPSPVFADVSDRPVVQGGVRDLGHLSYVDILTVQPQLWQLKTKHDKEANRTTQDNAARPHLHANKARATHM